MRRKGYVFDVVNVVLEEEVKVIDLSIGNSMTETAETVLPPGEYQLHPILNPKEADGYPWYTVNGEEKGLGLPCHKWREIIPCWPY
ncbi:hypothetical protein ACFL0Z_02100 [Patescibacteria group bacterium]